MLKMTNFLRQKSPYAGDSAKASPFNNGCQTTKHTPNRLGQPRNVLAAISVPSHVSPIEVKHYVQTRTCSIKQYLSPTD